MKELILELKNKSREDVAARTIKDLYARIEQLEAKVNTLDNLLDPLVPNPIRDPNQLTREIRLVRKSEAIKLLQQQQERRETALLFGLHGEAQTTGTTRLDNQTSLDEMERRTQRMKKALNMEGTKSY